MSVRIKKETLKESDCVREKMIESESKRQVGRNRENERPRENEIEKGTRQMRNKM